MNNTNCSDDNIHVLFHLYCFKHRYFMVWLVKEIDGKFHCRIWKICWSLRHLWLIWKISLTGINLATQQIQPLQGCQRWPQIGSYWSQIGQIWDFFFQNILNLIWKSPRFVPFGANPEIQKPVVYFSPPLRSCNMIVSISYWRHLLINSKLMIDVIRLTSITSSKR